MRQLFSMICCILLKKLQKEDYNPRHHGHYYIALPLVINGWEFCANQ